MANTIIADIGECIYCGLRPPAVELTDEHVIPFGLGGNSIVPDASCKTCAAITGRFEGTLQRDMLLPLRTLLEIQTRRPKERPTSLPLELTMIDGSHQVVDIPLEEYALQIVMPELDRPTFFDNLPPSKSGSVRFHSLGVVGDIQHILTKYGATRVGWPAKIRPDLFARFLAKVGHSAAALFGFYGQFEPVLRPLILGDMTHPWHWIGGEHGKTRYPPTQDSHIVDVKWQTIRGREYLVAAIWVFADFGTPVHYAVIGPRLER